MRNQAPAESNGRKIDPTIGGIFAHKREPIEKNAAVSRIIVPPLAGDLYCLLGISFGLHFRNRKMRNVRPFFCISQRFLIQSLVKLLHAGRPLADSDIYRRCGGNKRLHFAKGQFEWFYAPAHPRQHVQRFRFASTKRPWRKKSKMGGKMGQSGVQFPPQVLDERG
jgi:hypothetical protein